MHREAPETNRDLLITAFGGKMFALERANGAVRWHLVLENNAFVIDLHIGATVVLAVTISLLVFIDYATGSVHRKVKQAGEYRAARPQVLIDGQHLFVARNGEVVCYTLGGDHVWTQPFTGQGYGEVALGFPGNVRQADDRGSR